MIVYLVFRDMGYDGKDLVTVFSNEPAAHQCANRLVAKEQEWERKLGTYIIEDWPVDDE